MAPGCGTGGLRLKSAEGMGCSRFGRRLKSLHAQLAGAASVAPMEPAQPTGLTTSPRGKLQDKPRLLSDMQLQEFIANGVLELDINELPASFHAAVHERAQEHHKSGRWPGSSNNIYSAMPELAEVFQGPTCVGALSSVLGPNYVMHAHRHMHVTGMNSFQQFHKDGQSGHGPVRHHRIRWAMIMYYPGGATIEMGPTAVIPSSHLLSIDNENWQPIVDPDGDQDAPRPTELSPGLREWKVTSPVGSPRAIMIHYDMLHRGTGRLLEECPEAPWRPMFKFQFMRTEEPTGPTHECSDTPATPCWPSSPLAPAWQTMWEWLHGARPGSLPAGALEAPPQQAIFAEGINKETERIGAAYAQARSKDAHVLEKALRAGTVASRRAAMYGLAAAHADDAVPLLLPLLEEDDEDVRTSALFALGEAAQPTLETISALKSAFAAARARLHGDASGDLNAGDPLATTGPGAQPPRAWKELQIAGQAVYCLATKLAARANKHSAPPGDEEKQIFSLAKTLLEARNADLLPDDATDDELGTESDGAVSNKAPGLRRHGVHALLSLAGSSHIGSAEWRRILVDTAMAATADEDRYVQQPAWQALQRLSLARSAAGETASAADTLIDRLVELRLCPVTATGSGF